MKKSEISNILNKMKVKEEQLEKKIKKQNADKLKNYALKN